MISSGLALGQACGHVVPGWLVVAQSDDHDPVQRGVGLTVTAPVEAMADRLARGRRDREAPHSIENAASLRSRSGLSLAATSRAPAPGQRPSGPAGSPSGRGAVGGARRGGGHQHRKGPWRRVEGRAGLSWSWAAWRVRLTACQPSLAALRHNSNVTPWRLAGCAQPSCSPPASTRPRSPTNSRSLPRRSASSMPAGRPAAPMPCAVKGRAVRFPGCQTPSSPRSSRSCSKERRPTGSSGSCGPWTGSPR